VPEDLRFSGFNTMSKLARRAAKVAISEPMVCNRGNLGRYHSDCDMREHLWGNIGRGLVESITVVDSPRLFTSAVVMHAHSRDHLLSTRRGRTGYVRAGNVEALNFNSIHSFALYEGRQCSLIFLNYCAPRPNLFHPTCSYAGSNGMSDPISTR
jgi:hypothetical protein